jgi:hypothetical protein
MVKGTEVPFSLEKLLEDKEAAEAFASNAQKTLQK